MTITDKQAEAIREILTECEFKWSVAIDEWACPECHNFKGDGHADDCVMATTMRLFGLSPKISPWPVQVGMQ